MGSIIPAYVPGTFTAITTKDGIRYCTLEEGIGVPPGKQRVYLYFQHLPEAGGSDIYSKLFEIYKGIVRDRTPVLQLPEDADITAQLRLEYSNLNKKFLECGFSPTLGRQDLVEEVNKNQGEAASIVTVPLVENLGGSSLHDTVSRLQHGIASIIRESDEEEVVTWVPLDNLLLTFVKVKSHFSGILSLPSGVSGFFKALSSKVSGTPPFRMAFETLVISP